ncbi:hypothetical protein GWP43_00900 [Treponema vincentii]|uniref:Uncharacterized protein n=1 Tax=Treponema vincentii TaxID=69710 RepID=A0A6P1XXK5_9SPIR|nr:hypothetical protein [Treponema vincentii]QHX42246.1 hypothetical protein GWP43_00900 [Treponema vincentii]
MNELFFTTLALVFSNTIIIRLVLFALSSNEYSKKIRKLIKRRNSKWILIQRITGIIYWKDKNILLKISVIVLILSYILILYALIILILSKVNNLSNTRLISVPLKIFCIIASINFALLYTSK